MKTVISAAFTLVFLLATARGADADPMKGSEIFNKKCSACHNITDKLKVGPGLEKVSKRHSAAWLEKWLTDPQAAWIANDKETQELKSRVKDGTKRDKTKMVIKLDPKDIPDIIDYLKKL